MKKKRRVRLQSYKIQLKTGDWIKVREVLPTWKRGRFRADFLGAYSPAKKTIEILPAKIMYKIVLDHEAGHAASRLSWIMHMLIGWKMRAWIPLGTSFLFFYLGALHLIDFNGTLGYGMGLVTGLLLLGVLGSLEEIKNRYASRERARQIVLEDKPKYP